VLELQVEQVRDTLTNAGAHWGKVNLSGNRVIIRSRRAVEGQGLMAMTPVALPGAAAPEPPKPAPDQQDALTPAESLIREHRPVSEIQLELSCNDPTILSTPDTAYRYELEMLSAIDSERLEVTVRFWQDGTVRHVPAVSARAMVVAITSQAERELPRNHLVGPGDVRQASLWLTVRAASNVVPAAEAEGRHVVRRVMAGEFLTSQDLRSLVVVKRGDRVMVRCLVGGVAISVPAEAQQDAGRGETIEMRKPGERTSFLATVTAPGEATVDLRQ
jgi:flagella basal body P-ring formation protein FlgA